ncbi:MAG TPA: helix-turn-helix transcriptional regulator [Streptosporangiaceae bacterium]|jgi:transcriptional regulator with XRE-family HTH domain
MSSTETGRDHRGDPAIDHQWAGPTAARILVGAQLRRLREAAGVTREHAAQVIRGSESKISRLELGRTGFKQRDLDDLLRLYGVTPEEAATLLALAKQANKPGWWHSFGDAVPDWFEAYLGLEGAAAVIRTYEVQFVPGLLQTTDYARAMMRLGPADLPGELAERRVALRMRRQELLQRADPPRLWTVIDEAALRRPIGGREVMRAQLRHLIEVSALPAVSVQILPFSVGQVALVGAMIMLRFPQGELPDVVYEEQFTGACYYDKPAETEQYRHVLNQLGTAAQPPTATPSVLERILTEI